jgi:hypothetical protein
MGARVKGEMDKGRLGLTRPGGGAGGGAAQVPHSSSAGNKAGAMAKADAHTGQEVGQGG